MLLVPPVRFLLWKVKMSIVKKVCFKLRVVGNLQCLTSTSLVCVPVEFFMFRLLRRSRLLGGGSVLWALFDQPDRQCWTRPETKTIKIKLINLPGSFKHTGVNAIWKITEGKKPQLSSCNFLSYSPTVIPNYQKGQNCIADELCTCKVAKGRSEGCWPLQIKQKENSWDNIHAAKVVKRDHLNRT